MVASPGESAVRRLAYLLQVLAAMVLFCAAAEARTAHIALTVTGDETMSNDLQQLIEQFQKDQPLTGDSLSLLQGAQAALARVNTALRSRGFYDGRVTATIDSRPVGEPTALDAIDAHPDNQDIAVDMAVDTGPRFTVENITVRGSTEAASPPIDMSKIGLAKGDPADAAAIIAAQDMVLIQFRRDGYA